jgi:aerobic-type carbon monoxide dehydrogenase small subunit (CoxS/CutS family)
MPVNTEPDGLSPETRRITLCVNGKQRDTEVDDGDLLVEVLRERLGLTGTHIGCLNGDCGACTVRIDERIAKSCLVLAASVDGASVTTIEAIAGPDDALSRVQQAFWDLDAFQCGFCLPGHLFVAEDLLARTPNPTETDIRDALVGNLCRCTGYARIVAAIKTAASAIEPTQVSQNSNVASQD